MEAFYAHFSFKGFRMNAWICAPLMCSYSHTLHCLSFRKLKLSKKTHIMEDTKNGLKSHLLIHLGCACQYIFNHFINVSWTWGVCQQHACSVDAVLLLSIMYTITELIEVDFYCCHYCIRPRHWIESSFISFTQLRYIKTGYNISVIIMFVCYLSNMDTSTNSKCDFN